MSKNMTRIKVSIHGSIAQSHLNKRNNKQLFFWRKSELVGSKLLTGLKGRGFKYNLTQHLIEMMLKSCQDRFLYLILVTEENIGSQMGHTKFFDSGSAVLREPLHAPPSNMLTLALTFFAFY